MERRILNSAGLASSFNSSSEAIHLRISEETGVRRLQCLKHSFQRILKIRITVISGISLYLAADLKKTADRKQFIDTDDRTDLQTLDGATDVADAAERYRTFLINTERASLVSFWRA